MPRKFQKKCPVECERNSVTYGRILVECPGFWGIFQIARYFQKWGVFSRMPGIFWNARYYAPEFNGFRGCAQIWPKLVFCDNPLPQNVYAGSWGVFWGHPVTPDFARWDPVRLSGASRSCKGRMNHDKARLKCKQPRDFVICKSKVKCRGSDVGMKGET